MSKENTLSNICRTYDLKKLICGPTCNKGAKSTAVDVILSSDPKRFKHTINEPCFLSDFHNVICTVTKLLCPPIVPKRIYYRSYKYSNEESYVKDLHSAPFMVCDIFDDPGDKAWCFTKVLTDVMEKNAPVKSKVIKKPQIPYMNPNLRKAMHRRNMLRNKYKKGLMEWHVYRIQRNVTTSIYKKSRATYFSERCEGGGKNQKFWKTIKPVLTSKQPSNSNIILKENEKIITDEREICDIFNEFFSYVAMDIGFKDDIPDDFHTADGLAKIIDKHYNHPSVIKIRENIRTRQYFYFTTVTTNFNYCPLVCFFTSRESIDKIDKIQERALRFVLKDHISNYKNPLLKSDFDSFRIYAVKSLMTELFKILEGMTPNYLSELFVKADMPYDTRDKCKLIQPLKRTSIYDVRSFQYYGAHVWNILPINIKAAQSLHEFKSLIRSWPGPTCSCHICSALLWLMINWLIDRIYFNWCYSYTCTLGTGLSVWRLCCHLWQCGLSVWPPAVPPVDAESSHWQLLSVLVFIPYEYICHQIVARADMFMSLMFCFTIINDWVVDLLYFD